jgi:hypothetical protein
MTPFNSWPWGGPRPVHLPPVQLPRLLRRDSVAKMFDIKSAGAESTFPALGSP